LSDYRDVDFENNEYLDIDMNSVLDMFQRCIANLMQYIVNVPNRQTRFIMVIVCVALLLDNMLYMVIVSI
jgi:hypothetical protein